MYELKTVKITLNMYHNRHESGYNIKKILKISEIARSTLYQWINIYGKYFINNSDASRNIPKDNIIKVRMYNRLKSHKKFDDLCIKTILEYVTKNPIINVKKLKKLILIKHKVHINKNYIYKILKDNNITRKKSQKHKYPYDKEKRNEQERILKEKINEVNNDYISIDETGIVLKMKSEYGWSKSGTNCHINEPNNYEARYSLCMAINKDKILGYCFKKGTFRGRNFRNFLINKIISKDKRNILMDNATIHKTKALKKELERKKVGVIYNVPYCPEYNPIEFVFNTLKSFIKKEYICNYKQLQYKMKIFIGKINEEGLNNYYKRTLENLLKEKKNK